MTNPPMDRAAAEQTTKNIALVGRFLRETLTDPDRFDAIPDDATLVLMPPDDPDLAAANLHLAERLAPTRAVRLCPVGQPLPEAEQEREDGDAPRFANLDEAAAAATDIPYRHLYVSIEDHDKSAFARRLSRTMDDLARVGAQVIDLSTETVVEGGARLRIAQLVVAMKCETIDSIEGGASGYVPMTAEPEGLIGFEAPRGPDRRSG